MESTHCVLRHGFISVLLVIIVSSVSCFASKINGSYNARGTKIHEKHILTSSKSEGYSSPNQKTLCVHKPGPQKIWPIRCDLDREYIITAIKFADYGQPTGDCKMFKRGNCGAPATLRLVKKNCLGKEGCWLPVTDEMFGPTHCKGPVSFAVSATCTKKKSSLKD